MRKRRFCTSKSIHDRGAWTRSPVALFFTFGTVGPVWAHGFGQRYDLPVPLWLYVSGAAAAVVLSFVMVGAFVRGASGLQTYPRLNLLRSPVGRLLTHPVLRLCLQGLSVGLFVLVMLAGWFGTQNATGNLAPTLVWVVWWVGLAYVSALIGNLWALINPWAILFAWAEAMYRRVTHGRDLSRRVPYPAALGVWPGAVLFLGFAWTELVFEGAAVPAKLAGLILIYSCLTWAGMLLFGKDVWLRYGEVFSLVFGLLARFAPTEVRVVDPDVCQACDLHCRDLNGSCIDCYACFRRAEANRAEFNLRPYAVGLARDRSVSVSEMVFVLLLLATVTFDGFMATPLWASIETSLQGFLADLGGARIMVVKTLGLVAFPLLFLEVYVLFSVLMATFSGGRFTGARLTRVFAFSLVPIAIAYHVAHYLSFLLIQGQRMIPLLSDPFGFGWNVLGTAAYRVNIGIVDARFGWYTAVLTIVVGHVLAVYLAHLVALRTLRDHTLALRSQYPMLVLMVAYTVISLWILAQPIVEGGGGGKTRQAALSRSQKTVDTQPGRPERFSAILEALGRRPRQTFEVDIRSTTLCFCLGKGPETIRELRRVADEWFDKGLLASTVQDYQEAIVAFTKAIQLSPGDARVYVYRGIMYAKTGKYLLAKADFTKAVALDPQAAEAHDANNLISTLLGDNRQAKQDVQVATQ